MQWTEPGLATAVDTMLDPLVVLSPVRDAVGDVVDFAWHYVNQAGTAVLGAIGSTDLVGRRLLETYPALRDTLYPAYVRAMAADEPFRADRIVIDTTEPGGSQEGRRRTVTIRAVRVDDWLVVSWRDGTDEAAAQEALAQSELHYRLLAENMSDVVVRESGDGTIAWVSASVARATGWQPADVCGHRMIDFVHPEDQPEVRRQETRATAGLTPELRYECRIRDFDGTYGWFSVQAAPLENGGGQLDGRVVTWRDIDDEMAARRRAATREAEYRLLAENASDLVVRLGPDGTIHWVSPAAGVALGLRPEEIVGHSIGDYVHPDDADAFLAGTQASHHHEPARRSGRLCRADGSYAWFAAVVTDVPDGNGSGSGRVLGLRSIDAEVEAMRALALSEERFRTAMVSAPGGMAVVDLERGFVEVNDALAAMVRRDRRWLLDRGIADVVHPDDDATDEALREQIADGRMESAVVECRLLRSDGGVLWVQHAIGLLRDDRGEARGSVSQFVDVTRARSAREELEYLATHDPLTRLANRHALVTSMREILSHPPRAGQRQGVLFLDVDGLKQVNDRFGHIAGDELIVRVADRIRSTVRTEDHVARLGGDEFVVLLPSVNSLDDVVAIGEKIRSRIAGTISIAEADVVVTASAGATLARTGEEPQAVIDRADRALYRAKAAGRDRTVASGTAGDE